MKVYLIRHTAVDVPQGMCYGQTDVPLKASFEEESKLVQVVIKELTPDAIFSSPLSRCTRLANSCGYSNALLDDRLKELNFGAWEGRQWDALDMSVWENDWISSPPPQGESFIEMYDRVASFFDELKDADYESVIIFTHGGVISCARIYFEQVEIEHAFDQKINYGELMKFEY